MKSVRTARVREEILRNDKLIVRPFVKYVRDG